MTKIITPKPDSEDAKLYDHIELYDGPDRFSDGAIFFKGRIKDDGTKKAMSLWHSKRDKYQNSNKSHTLDVLNEPSSEPIACNFNIKQKAGDPKAIVLADLYLSKLIESTDGWTETERIEETDHSERIDRTWQKPRSTGYVTTPSSSTSTEEDIRPLPAGLENERLVLHMPEFKRHEKFIAATFDREEGTEIRGNLYLTDMDRWDELRTDKELIDKSKKNKGLHISKHNYSTGAYIYPFRFEREGATVDKNDAIFALKEMGFIPHNAVWKNNEQSQQSGTTLLVAQTEEGGHIYRLQSKRMGGSFERIEVNEHDITNRDVSGTLVLRKLEDEGLKEVLLDAGKDGGFKTRFGTLWVHPRTEKDGFYYVDFIATPKNDNEESVKLEPAAMPDFIRNLFTELQIAPLSCMWDSKPQAVTHVTEAGFTGQARTFAQMVEQGVTPSGQIKPDQTKAELTTETLLHMGHGLPLSAVECITSSDPAQPVEGKLLYKVSAEYPADKILGDLEAAIKGTRITLGKHEVRNIVTKDEDGDFSAQRLTVNFTGGAGMDDVMKLVEKCPGHCEAGNFMPMPQRAKDGMHQAY